MDDYIARLHTGTKVPHSFSRVTVFGDSHHGDIEILRTFNRTFKSFVEDGGRVAFLEIEKTAQLHIDWFMRGIFRYPEESDVLPVDSRVPTKHLLEAQYLWADIIFRAARENVKLVCADIRGNKTEKDFPDFSRVMFYDDAKRERALARMAKKPDFEEREKAYLKAQEDDSLILENHIVKLVRESREKGDKVLVFTGAGHLRQIHLGLMDNDINVYVVCNVNIPYGVEYDKNYSHLPLFPEGAMTRPVADLGKGKPNFKNDYVPE